MFVIFFGTRLATSRRTLPRRSQLTGIFHYSILYTTDSKAAVERLEIP